jgi:segregation and condensation protein A
MAYHVKLEKFEGPLDLLLSQIEKRKLPINEVSLSKVTDDFIAYIENTEQFPIGESAHFILIASTLLLIKSKSLLPTLELTTEEQGNIEDLEKRLKQYKRIKELSLHVKERFGKTVLFAPMPRKNIKPVFSPDSKTSISFLRESINKILESIPKIEKLPNVVLKKVMSLEEMIEGLTDRITRSLKMSFKEFSATEKTDKVNIIVSFLAMLELVKRGVIKANQENMFDDISMETEEIGIPKYS